MQPSTLSSRFIFVLNDLIIGGIIESKCEFCKLTGMEGIDLDEIEKVPDAIVSPKLLFIIMDEFGVCAHWLITGQGPMYSFLINVCKVSFGVPKRYLCLN